MADKKTTQPDTVEKSVQKQVVAHARSLRIAPRKLRLVANSVKQMRAQDALVHLKFLNKKGADMVTKLIQSAMANAEHNFSYDTSGLFIKSITCDAGQVLKRFMPRARGSASPLNRRMSHLHVTLEFKPLSVKKNSRFAQLLSRSKSATEKKVAESEVAAPEVLETTHKTESPKTSEQVKQNRVQQKRRLFNRRIGE